MNPAYIQIGVVIGLAAISGLGAIIGYLLKDIRSSVKEQQQDHKEAIEEVKKDLANFKEQVPKEYVLRDDFVRTIGSIEYRINQVGKDVKELLKLLSERRSTDEPK